MAEIAKILSKNFSCLILIQIVFEVMIVFKMKAFF